MIIYLHGFNSSGESQKGQYLRQTLDISVVTPSYSYQPDVAVASIRRIIEEHLPTSPRLILMGSSLGGFYARYLGVEYGLKTVMINPALGPVDTLRPSLGWNRNFYTGEEYLLNDSHLEALRHYQVELPCTQTPPSLVLLDENDELIDYRYAWNIYQPCKQAVLFPGGDHQFQHLPESVPLIRQFYFR